jgi:hypothetical protein
MGMKGLIKNASKDRDSSGKRAVRRTKKEPNYNTRETTDTSEPEMASEYVFESELKEGILKSDSVKYSVWEDKKQRIQKAHMFFTWSNNDSHLTKTKIKEFLERELTVYNINYVIVSERCKSGKEHFHAVVTGSKLFDLQDKERFNIYEEGKCHVPYVLFPKKYSDVAHLIWYMQKEDKEPIYKGYKKENAQKKIPNGSRSDVLTNSEFLKAVQSSKTASECLSNLGDQPYNPSIANSFARLKTDEPYIPPSVTLDYGKTREEFIYPKVIKNWFQRNVDDRNRDDPLWMYSRTDPLVIVGPPGTSKTSMVRAWGPHLYFSGSKLTMQDFDPMACIPPEVKYIVIDDASGLFRHDGNYDSFGKQLLNSKGVFRAHTQNLTNVACYNYLPVVWIQNCNDTTYKFWEEKDPSDWKLGSTYVECVPVKEDKYDEINERYLEQTGYFDKGSEEIIEPYRKKRSLNTKAKELEVQYASSGREMSDLYSFSKKDREAKIKQLSSLAGIDEGEFKKLIYGDIPEEEVGVYVQWEVVQDGEEESVQKYYRSLTKVEKQREVIRKMITGGESNVR